MSSPNFSNIVHHDNNTIMLSASSPNPQVPYPSPSAVLLSSSENNNNNNNHHHLQESSSKNQNRKEQSQTSPSPTSSFWSLDDFEFGRQIGEGRFGTVYLAREKSTGYKVAVKAVRKEDVIRLDMKHQLEREVRLQKYASRHPHVLGMFAYFWDDKFIYLVMEYADGGDLSQFVAASSSNNPDNLKYDNNNNNNKSKSKGSRNDEATVSCWIRQLLDAVAFMHEKRLLHRDIKPENIMLKRGRIKLGDFTWCVSLGKEAPFDRRRTICGTLDYLSPELISHLPYDTQLDVWSVGVVAYELLVGVPPFEHPRPVDTCLSIQRGEFVIPENSMSELAEDFLKKVLIVEPEKRPSCRELLKHPWIEASPPTPISERRRKYLQSKSRSRSRSSQHHQHHTMRKSSSSNSRSRLSENETIHNKNRTSRSSTSSARFREKNDNNKNSSGAVNKTSSSHTTSTLLKSNINNTNNTSRPHISDETTFHHHQNNASMNNVSAINKNSTILTHNSNNVTSTSNSSASTTQFLDAPNNVQSQPQYNYSIGNNSNNNQQLIQPQQQAAVAMVEEENVSRALELSGIGENDEHDESHHHRQGNSQHNPFVVTHQQNQQHNYYYSQYQNSSNTNTSSASVETITPPPRQRPQASQQEIVVKYQNDEESASSPQQQVRTYDISMLTPGAAAAVMDSPSQNNNNYRPQPFFINGYEIPEQEEGNGSSFLDHDEHSAIVADDEDDE